MKYIYITKQFIGQCLQKASKFQKKFPYITVIYKPYVQILIHLRDPKLTE